MATINGTNTYDVLWGGNFGDLIYGNGGNDYIIGGSAQDWIVGGAGADTIYGGAGYDGVDYSDSTTGVFVQIGGGYMSYGGTAHGDKVQDDIEAVWASEHDDIVFGNHLANDLFGNGGDDSLYGGAGDDHIEGGAGDDLMTGGTGADYFSGGSGEDTVTYVDSFDGVTATIEGPNEWPDTWYAPMDGTAEGDTITETVENVTGSNFDDYLIGNDYGNVLRGGAGSDDLSGRGGSDLIIGGAGADILIGGGGYDTVSYIESAQGVFVTMNGGGKATGGDAEGDIVDRDFEAFVGSQFRDVVTGNGYDNSLFMNGGDDYASGGVGDDNLYGNAGHDYMLGDAGDDDLFGNEGNDTLLGGANDDRLVGGDGNDKLTGGTGADSFKFTFEDLGDTDTIIDFRRSEGDKINLSMIDANTTVANGNQAFSFVGTAAFTGVAGQLHYNSNGIVSTLTGDTNGDKLADFTIILSDAPGLIASDFLL
jgi:Ca2+-binding RTX toxin-like protein